MNPRIRPEDESRSESLEGITYEEKAPSERIPKEKRRETIQWAQGWLKRMQNLIAQIPLTPEKREQCLEFWEPFTTIALQYPQHYVAVRQEKQRVYVASDTNKIVCTYDLISVTLRAKENTDLPGAFVRITCETLSPQYLSEITRFLSNRELAPTAQSENAIFPLPLIALKISVRENPSEEEWQTLRIGVYYPFNSTQELQVKGFVGSFTMNPATGQYKLNKNKKHFSFGPFPFQGKLQKLNNLANEVRNKGEEIFSLV